MKMKDETGISPGVRRAVYERDRFDGWVCCVFCGRPSEGQYTRGRVEYEYGIELAHYIGRAQGGKGIPENLVCLCPRCHQILDNGSDTAQQNMIKNFQREYLQSHYPYWSEDRLKVKK